MNHWVSLSYGLHGLIDKDGKILIEISSSWPPGVWTVGRTRYESLEAAQRAAEKAVREHREPAGR